MKKTAQYWQEQVDEHREQIIADLQTLVQVPSIYDEGEITLEAPLGEPIRRAFDCMYEFAERDGFDHENFDYCAGEITSGGGEEIAFVGHLDVVPVGDGWNYPQFGGVIDNGRIYGRGADDNKGGVIAAYSAMRLVSQLPEVAGKQLKLILGGDEETSIWRCLDTYFKYRQKPKYAIVPDGDFPMTYAEKGFIIYDVSGTIADSTVLEWDGGTRANIVPDEARTLIATNDPKQLADQYEGFLAATHLHGAATVISDSSVELTAIGISVHAKHPADGHNAHFTLLQFFESVHLHSPVIDILAGSIASDTEGKLLGIDIVDDEMGALTLNAGILRYHAGQFYMRLNIRYPKGFDDKQKVSEMNQHFAAHQLVGSMEAFYPLHYTDPKGTFVKTLHNIYKEHTHDDTPLATTGGGTYARAFPGAVCFGPLFPGDAHVAHEIDEYISIDTLLKATAIYADVFYTLATKK